MKLERLAISCGGTGGHFNPGLSIARELKARGGTPVLVLGGAHVEKQAKIASEFGIDVIRIEAAPISVKPWKAIPFLWKTWKGVGQCAAGFRQYRPQALLCMGILLFTALQLLRLSGWGCLCSCMTAMRRSERRTVFSVAGPRLWRCRFR